MAALFTVSRLENGPAIVLANTPANLPTAPFHGLRLGDIGISLVPSQFYQLRPGPASPTVEDVIIDGSATWQWVVTGPTPPLPAGSVQIVSPAFDATVLVTLPDVSTFASGALFALLVKGSNLGSAVVVVTPAGGQTFDGGSAPLRLYESGTLLLRADPGGLDWQIVSLDQGAPEDVVVFASNAGSDANAGTAASPVRSLRTAIGKIGVPWWRTATVRFVGAYVDDPNNGSPGEPVLIPGPRPVDQPTSIQGLPLRIAGEYQTAAGFPVSIAATGGTAFAAGPPVAFPTVTYAAQPALAANGGVGKFVRFTSGPLSGLRFAITQSTNVALEFASDTPAAPVAGNAFVIEDCAAQIDSPFELIFAAGTGQGLILDAVDLQPSDANFLVFTGLITLCQGAILGGTAVQFDRALVLGPSGPEAAVLTATSWIASGLLPNTTTGNVARAELDAGRAAVLSSTMAYLASAAVFGAASLAAVGIDTGLLVEANGAALLTGSLARGQVTVRNSGTATIDGLTANHASGDGVRVAERGVVQLQGVQGTLTDPAAFGVNADTAARVRIVDAGAGTTITGPGGDVRVGVLGAKTYAQIAAAAVADTLELVGAGATATSVTP